MAVIHADLVGPLPEGKNSRGQRGFQYILSVIDSATRYLWLLPIRHKTAECVAATLFDEVISRVSVPSAILTDQGGEFMGEVVECLLRRLGISHLRSSAYHPQTDAKCEKVHFSVHNIITKLIDDKHERWPDLLGTVALAYNATVHTSTGYSPHELFYSFPPSCPLDAVVSTPAADSVSNTDEYTLQAFERLQEAVAFVRDFTCKQIQRMKKYYNSSVKPTSYEEGEKVLVYNPRKRSGHFAKWAICWQGPWSVQRKLYELNYVVRKGAKGKCIVDHVNRMRKLPISQEVKGSVESSVESSDWHMHTRENNEPTIPPGKRSRTQPATDIDMPSIHTAETANHGNRADEISPVDKATDSNSEPINAAAEGVPNNPDTKEAREQAYQSTSHVGDTAIVPTGQNSRPQPETAGRPTHSHNRPIRYLDTVEASLSLIGR